MTEGAATHTPTPGELAHRAKDEARDAGYERAGVFLLMERHEQGRPPAPAWRSRWATTG